MSRKKRRHYNGPPKGAVVIYENSPRSRWINQWFPPKGSAAFFHMESDFEFQRRHPVGYVFAVLLGIFALLCIIPFLFVVIISFLADLIAHRVDPRGRT